jgi:hypothetical protein
MRDFESPARHRRNLTPLSGSPSFYFKYPWLRLCTHSLLQLESTSKWNVQPLKVLFRLSGDAFQCREAPEPRRASPLIESRELRNDSKLGKLRRQHHRRITGAAFSLKSGCVGCLRRFRTDTLPSPVGQTGLGSVTFPERQRADERLARDEPAYMSAHSGRVRVPDQISPYPLDADLADHESLRSRAVAP